ncbi:hypothetical protein [Tessaracoccus rhinocerotis]|uniref:hypothetical protein n=1 Tax=Tessaracoccus rhinocerotis TaxID=1689449 RepID=UPI001C8F2146|nr:hypothetical protein [Tessaracoccus rhinocerotis]
METNFKSRTKSQPSGGRVARALGHLMARWPAALGLLALLANLADGADPHVTAMIIIIAATCYLGAAVLGSRRSVWVMVVATSAVVVLASVAGLDPTAALIAMGIGLAVFGLISAKGSRRRDVGVQALGFLCYTAVGVAAMMSAPVPTIYLAATAAIGHTLWDVVHFIRDKVVTRSLAEACFVLDLGLAVALLVSAWSALPQ